MAQKRKEKANHMSTSIVVKMSLMRKNKNYNKGNNNNVIIRYRELIIRYRE